MFNSVHIKNFQSHKDSKIKFDNGVNVLVGSSDQGKSAILRAILWAVNNRPLGTDDIVSHWARDNKNKIKEDMSVKVKTENGLVIRKRTIDANEYILKDATQNEKIFSAINKDVPQDVINFFKLSDVNIQNQHDAPFLLSSSASDVAKYFNKIVRLDVIDIVLGNAESARRDTNKKIKETENEKKNLEKQLDNYSWIENAQEIINKLENTNYRMNVYVNDCAVVANEIELYNIQKDYFRNFPDIKNAKIIIEKIEDIKIDYELLKDIEGSIEKYKNVNKKRMIFEIVDNGKDIINQIEKYKSNIDLYKAEIENINNEIINYDKNKKLSDLGFNKECVSNLIKEIELIKPEYEIFRSLSNQINEYFKNKDYINSNNSLVDTLKNQLPDVCPTCGSLMKGNK